MLQQYLYIHCTPKAMSKLMLIGKCQLLAWFVVCLLYSVNQTSQVGYNTYTAIQSIWKKVTIIKSLYHDNIGSASCTDSARLFSEYTCYRTKFFLYISTSELKFNFELISNTMGVINSILEIHVTTALADSITC